MMRLFRICPLRLDKYRNGIKIRAKEQEMKMQSRIYVVLIFFLSAMFCALQGLAQEGNETGVDLKPSPDAISKAQNPSPPADAQKSDSIGKGILR